MFSNQTVTGKGVHKHMSYVCYMIQLVHVMAYYLMKAVPLHIAFGELTMVTCHALHSCCSSGLLFMSGAHKCIFPKYVATSVAVKVSPPHTRHLASDKLSTTDSPYANTHAE